MTPNASMQIFKKIQKIIISIIILISAVTTTNCQEINNGVLDLSHSGQLEDNVIDLTGNWQFYSGKLLTAEQMNKLPISYKRYIKTPGSWTDYTTNGTKIPAFGIGTYYLKIVLNKTQVSENKDYGFKISSIISAYNLYINDQLIGSAGIASTNIENYIPTYYPQSCYFHSNVDTLKVIFHVTNFTDPLYGGIWKKMYFGNKRN